MRRFRSFLALILVGVTTLLVSCSSPDKIAVKPTYTTDQLEQIEQYSGDLEVFRDRLQEIPALVVAKRWNDVYTLIHGPLGELRVKMSTLSRTLLPSFQANARQSAQDVFGHLNAIDEAAQARDQQKALKNYNAVLEDFDAFLNLLPDIAS